ncbi:hypothetical protein PspCFBP13509_08780 [Pseudomonas sp. CFBP13509]|uniref:hypothetical protein n=1 Tax=unclassified Pseudomonas TaxID=196821 RepID=UPI0010C155A2|nr:hypothetical protein [Pseudomonas sp. CFBP13509]TKJ80319.1 hypothetical protein PspCFBP13509_08780 [Pseudomonas sp. CFBP13509]
MVSHYLKHYTMCEVASFDPNTFLENIAVRVDGSMLVTVVFHRALWLVPAVGSPQAGKPQLLHTFDCPAMGIVEMERDVFYVCSSAPGKGMLYRVDLRAWSSGDTLQPELVATFPAPIGMLNGSCKASEGVILIADCFAGLIWRVNVNPDGRVSAPSVWLAHPTMEHQPLGPFPQQPGVNGVKFAATTGWLYYTSTAQGLFMRVAVDPNTFNAIGVPEQVACGMMGDDFCLDEAAGFAYVTTHRENTIDLISLTPGENDGNRRSIVGNPYDERMTGPSAIAWGRGSEETGVVAYITTDGGVMSLKPGNVLKPAKVLRVEFSELESE